MEDAVGENIMKQRKGERNKEKVANVGKMGGKRKMQFSCKYFCNNTHTCTHTHTHMHTQH